MKKIYYIYDVNTFFVTNACFFEEGKQPFNAIFQENVDFMKPKFDPISNLIIEGATVEEVTVVTEAKEENTDKDEYNLLIENGNALFLRHQARLIRRVKKGSLTQARAKTVRTLLIETYTLMNMGLIELANDKANAIPAQTNNGIQNEITWMREKLTELLTNFNPLRTL
jgi:hypothetical protein